MRCRRLFEAEANNGTTGQPHSFRAHMAARSIGGMVRRTMRSTRGFVICCLRSDANRGCSEPLGRYGQWKEFLAIVLADGKRFTGFPVP